MIGGGHGESIDLRRVCPDCDQPFWIPKGKWAQYNGIYDTENRSCCSNAKCERKNSYNRKPGTLSMAAQTKSQLLTQAFQECPIPHAARYFFYERHVPEFA